MPTSIMPLTTANEASRRAYYTSGDHFGGERPVYDMFLRKYVSSKTGLNWSGPITGNGGVVLGHAVNGDFSTTAPPGTGNPLEPPALAVSRTVKTPEIANPTLAAINQANQQREQTTKDLTSFGNTASDILNRTYTRTQGALDTTQTANALNASLNTQEGAQRALTGQAETRNRNYAAENQKLLDEMKAAFADESSAARAVGNRAAAAAQTQAALIPLATNPDAVTSRSGAASSRAISAVAAQLLPVEQRIAEARRYNIANFERPIGQELYRNDMALLDAKNALERQFGGDRRSVIQYLQSLQTQAAGLDQESANWFIGQKLRMLGLPEQYLSANINNLTALARLLGVARSDEIARPFDPSLVPGAGSYPIVAPERNYTPQGPGPIIPNLTQTGNGGGQGIGEGYRAPGEVGGYQPMNQRERNYVYANPAAFVGQPRSYTPSTPFDPNRASGGWGYVDQNFIGQNADWWNNALSGTL